MAIRKQKRCPYCRRRFWADPRTEWRQWACSEPACQRRRRQETQRRYRRKNRSDRAGRQYREAVAAARSGEAVPGVPPQRGPLVSLPWDEMGDEIAPEVLVLLVLFGRLLVSLVKDESRAQVSGFEAEIARLRRTMAEDEISARARPP